MSDAKHTPEKWTYTIERAGTGNMHRLLADGTMIATVWIPETDDDCPYPVPIRTAVLRMLEAANACRGMADPAAEIAELRKKAHGWDLLIQTVQAMADTTTEGQPTVEALLDKVKENMELRAENDRLRRYVGDEMIRSDFKTAAQMRSQLEHYRSEVTALRRNEAEAIDAIKAVGYTTPHGESDSLGEAVAWLVAEAEWLRKAEEESDAARLAMAQRLTEIATAAYGYAPPDRAYGWATLADEVKRLRSVHVAADLLADAVECANVGAVASDGEFKGSVIPALNAYRKERAS